MSKQDRQGARTPADLEYKYRFGKSFREVMGIADDARTSAEGALLAAKKLDEGLTSEEIFNRLTENGAIEGIYRDASGQIYVNASYIKSGILLANLIKAGCLQSVDGETFYLDLEKGVLKGKFEELLVGGKTVFDIASEEASTAASAAVDAQTQESIFNKLTNNGVEQGIFLKDGKIYINATYLAAGILAAADGSFSLDLKNGGLTMNANGNEVMRVSKDGANIAGWEATEEYLGREESGLNGNADILGTSAKYNDVEQESKLRFFAGVNDDVATKYRDVTGTVNSLGYFSTTISVSYMVADTQAHQINSVWYRSASLIDSEIEQEFTAVRVDDKTLRIVGKVTSAYMESIGKSGGGFSLTVKLKYDIKVPAYQVLDDGTLVAKYALLGGQNIEDILTRITNLEDRVRDLEQ